jgi:hypothetical protein
MDNQIADGDIEDCRHLWTEMLDDINNTEDCGCGVNVCMDCGAEFATKGDM